MSEKHSTPPALVCSHGDDYPCYEDLKAERDRYHEALDKIKDELYGCDRVNCRASARSIARIIAEATDYCEPDADDGRDFTPPYEP